MNSAFYYPYVHFKNRHWLKSALLYYDEIVRVASPGVNLDTAEEYRGFRGDPLLLKDVVELKAAGVIRDEAPTARQLTQTADTFIQFASESLMREEDRKQVLSGFHSANPEIRLNPANMAPELLELLRDTDLAPEMAKDSQGLIRVEAVTAVAYATLMATELAGKRDLVTDDPTYHRMLLRSSAAIPAEEPAEDEALRIAALAFESVGFSQGVSIGKILKFREKFASERDRFGAAVRKLAASVGREGTVESVESCASTMTDALEVLKDKLRSQEVAYAGAVFSVSAPAWVTAAWGLAATTPTVVGSMIAIALGLGSVKHFYDRRALRRESSYTYLLEVSKNFGYAEMAGLMVLPLPFGDVEYRTAACPSY